MDWVKQGMRRLHDLLHRRGWKRQDMEDVIQDAFLRMQVYCTHGNQVRNPEAFLVRTALNLSMNSRTRDRSHLHIEHEAEDLQGRLGLEPAPEEVLAAEERLQDVVSRVEAMTPRTREIFLLHYIEDYSYPQISRQLGISISAIEKHMARAMLLLTQGADDA
jgi:RNA polymerase sigma-70 factor (ECF subfamily)